MTCSHVVGFYGPQPVEQKDWERTHRLYNKQVDDFNERNTKSGRVVTPPARLQTNEYCMMCGTKITWEMEDGIVKPKTA